MPYRNISELPEQVKSLPKEAQEMFLRVVNSALEQYEGNEEKAFAVAWAAIKKKWKKEDDKWVKYDINETYDIRNVEIFSSVGEPNGDKYDEADLEEMVNGFYETKEKIKPYLKLGHDEKQKLVQNDGLPSIGWIENLRKKGKKLVADFVKVPQKIYELIKAGAYRRISSEIFWNIKVGSKKYNKLLKAVALLGADTPAVMNLNDIISLYSNQDNNFEVKNYEFDFGEIKEMAKWDTKFINDLPDSSFAYIKPGGKKDEEGKTVPRSLRYLPYKDANGKIDLPHLRNALARLPQTNLSSAEKNKARSILIKAAKSVGVGEYEIQKLIEEEKRMDLEVKLNQLEEEKKKLEEEKKKLEEEKQKVEQEAEEAKKKAEEISQELEKKKEEETKTQINTLADELIQQQCLLPAQKEHFVTMMMHFKEDTKKYKINEQEKTIEDIFVDMIKSHKVDLSMTERTEQGDKRYSVDNAILAERAKEYAKKHNVSYADALIALSNE